MALQPFALKLKLIGIDPDEPISNVITDTTFRVVDSHRGVESDAA